MILCGAQHPRQFNDKIKKRMTSIVAKVNLQSLATMLFMLLLQKYQSVSKLKYYESLDTA